LIQGDVRVGNGVSGTLSSSVCCNLSTEFFNSIVPKRTFGVNVTKEKPRKIARGFVIYAVS
jgi:hypothetical protein